MQQLKSVILEKNKPKFLLQGRRLYEKKKFSRIRDDGTKNDLIRHKEFEQLPAKVKQ